MRPLLFATLLLLTVSVADTMTISNCLHWSREEDKLLRLMAHNYAQGLGHGWEAANTHLRRQGRPPLFCLPASAEIHSLDYANMLYVVLREPAQMDRVARLFYTERALEGLLLAALQRQFPCPTTD
jgi:hypothetical protein